MKKIFAVLLASMMAATAGAGVLCPSYQVNLSNWL